MHYAMKIGTLAGCSCVWPLLCLIVLCLWGLMTCLLRKRYLDAWTYASYPGHKTRHRWRVEALLLDVLCIGEHTA